MRLAWRRVKFPMLLPLRVAGRQLPERVVMEVRLVSPDGRVGVGEVSPLPGLHAESLDSLPSLLAPAYAVLNEALDATTDFPRLMTALNTRLDWRALPPSLRCGLEGAALRLLAGGGDMAGLLGLPVGSPPPSSGLFAGGLDDVGGAPLEAGCLKIKIGRRDSIEEAALVRAARAQLGPDAEIRLDANRAFSLDEALVFADAVRDARPVWIEEPLRDPAELPEFMTRSGLPVALDESLHEPACEALACVAGVAAWVLKPALLGVGATLAAFARAVALSSAPCCVVSSSFEGPVGLDLLLALAHVAPGLPAPGLGTARWFGEPEPEPWVAIHE